jgi:hypothetical protein
MIETMVQCPHCGQENPQQYRFCGMCGKAVIAMAPVPPKQVAPVPPASLKDPVPTTREVSKEVSRTPVSKTEDVPFTGPSFLGLSSGTSDSSPEYLLEDEASSSGRGKMFVTLLLLLAAAGLLGWKWHFGNFPWQSTSNVSTAPTTTAQSNAPATPENAPAATAPSSAAQNPADLNGQNQPASSPQNAAPAPSPNADNSGTQAAPDSSAAGNDATAAKSAKAVAPSDAGQSSEPAANEQSANDQVADKSAAAPKPAEQTPPVREATSRKVAATQDDSPESEAQALLTQGERYLNGNGVPQNCGLAQNSLRTAADRGNFQAVSDLATMYSTGHCVKRDLPTAYRWFVKALHQQPNNNRISTDLQVLWNQMSPQEKQVAMQR